MVIRFVQHHAKGTSAYEVNSRVVGGDGIKLGAVCGGFVCVAKNTQQSDTPLSWIHILYNFAGRPRAGIQR